MKAFLESLSLGSGAVFMAIGSAVLVWPLCHLRPVVFRWLGAVGAPLVLAFCLYWLPVWLGANPSEYSSWSFLIVGAWFLAGAVSSAAVVLILGKRTPASRPDHEPPNGGKSNVDRAKRKF
jgi:hypothetical protein